LAEEIVEIADRDGLRPARQEVWIDAPEWLMARLNCAELWGEARDQRHLQPSFASLTPEERERRALALIGRLQAVAAPVVEHEPIVYSRAIDGSRPQN